ncbi:MAG: STAS domain-containing protein [Gammaproteobacteria bacterium]|nr:STAS domain-containing protein [Gammaproteobacteria bacterium]MDH5777748.1 STAS domain-containing protein [Gammaproteobacteria bacterium]
MSFLKKAASGVTRIECEDVLDISKAKSLHEQLKESLGQGSEVELNAANIQRIDACVLQLFTAFFKAASTNSVAVRWVEPSDALLRSAKLLGLSSHLELNG